MESMSKRETPLQAAEMYPKVSEGSFSSSFPIRAPLTIDSDSEDFLSSNGKKFSTSSYGSDYSGYLTGDDNEVVEHSSSVDDEYNDVSRPFVKYSDDEMSEGSRFSEEFDVSRPFVKDPDEKKLEGSSFSEEFVDSRPFVTDPDDEVVVENSRVDKIDVYRQSVKNTNEVDFGRRNLGEELVGTRPTVKISDEEIVEEGRDVDDFDVSNPAVEPPVVDGGNLSPPKLGMPIAVLSRYSDDDSTGSEVEDDGFIGLVRAPSDGVVENNVFAPKVKAVALEEGEEDELWFEGSSSDEDVNGGLRSYTEKDIAEQDSSSVLDVNGIMEFDVGKGMEGNVSIEGSSVAEVVENEGLDKYLVEDVQAFETAELEKQVELGDKLEKAGPYLHETSNLNSSLMTQGQLHLPEIGLKSSEVDEDINLGGVLLGLYSCDIDEGSHSEEVTCRQGTVDEILQAEVNLRSEKGLPLHDSVIQDNNLEPVNSMNFKLDSEMKVADKDEAVFVEDLTEDVENSLSYDNATSGDSENIMERSERGVDTHDSLSYNLILDHVTSLNPCSGSEMKQDDTDHSGYLEILPEEAESSSDDNGETLMQVSERTIVLHDSDIYSSTPEPEVMVDTKDEAYFVPELFSKEVERSLLDDKAEGLVFGDSKTMTEILGELEQKFKHSESGEGSSHAELGGVADAGESEGTQLLDSSTLDALLKAMAGSGGVGSTFPSMRPTPDANSAHLFTHSELNARGDFKEIASEEERKLEKLQQILVKFLRLVQRLGLSTEDSIATQVLNRLVLASGRLSSQSVNLKSAISAAKEIEADTKNELDFSSNILVIGKTGVGKSATINSIFGQSKALTNAFHPATTTVKEIVGKIDGVKVRVLDTPGLRSSLNNESFNRKILLAIKKFTKKFPPDVVLYVDRVDTQSQDLSDLQLLRKITSSLGPAIWQNSVIVLTHAASTPPDGLFGSPLSFEVFVSQRSRAIQQMINYAIGDINMLNPVVPVENHLLCKRNEAGQIVLPDGQSWVPQLLLLCYSTKILFEANLLVKASQSLDHNKLLKLIGHRKSVLPLPYFVTSLLQSFSHPKLEREQNVSSVDSDIELGLLTDFDQEDEDEYDQLPPFKSLNKAEIATLSKELKTAYFDEFDYRVKLLKKKQWREDMKRMNDMEKKEKDGFGMQEEVEDQEIPANVSVPLPDMAIPLSFDGDNPSYRYRFLEHSSQLLTRPVLDPQGWDHDIGYDSVSLKQILEISNSFPAEISIQMTKDKKNFSLNMDSAVSTKHGAKGSSMAGLDIQTMGDQLAYILKGETKMKNLKTNETSAGMSVTLLGENVVPGFKLEDQLAVGRQLVLSGSTGITRSQGENAYGVKIEGHFREQDFPIGQDQSSVGLTLVQWRGDLVWVCNFQSEFSVGRSSKICLNAGLNNKGNGKFSVKINSSEQLKIAVLGLLPVANAIYRNFFPRVQ